MTILIPVPGDQLSLSLTCLQNVDRSKVVVLLTEVRDEVASVRHHKRDRVYFLRHAPLLK
nr:cryptochrome/photolyase family protein [Gluconobacter cerinus]